jgi:hypothetical protein
MTACMRTMRRRVVSIMVAVPVALITIAAGTAVAFPAARHITSALWNLPDRLPALPENSQVHFESGAEGYARDVAALLPAAIAQVEAARGRRFEHPVPVGVYATPEAYAAPTRPAAAIERGETIAIEDTGSFTDLSEIRFGRAPARATASHRTVMAYRQAGMFVSWLHDTDTPGFARMMNAILDGRPFVEAVDTGYHQDVQSLWQKFAQAGVEGK